MFVFGELLEIVHQNDKGFPCRDYFSKEFRMEWTDLL